MKPDLDAFCIAPRRSIREAIAQIDRHGHGIVFVVEEGRRLIGTVSDGDIRRAILAGIDLDAPVVTLLSERPSARYARPIAAPLGTPPDRLLHLMNEYSVRQIPILDGKGTIVDIALLSELAREYEAPIAAVVMAGGFGTRLRPLTEQLPKPMLPVGDRPILEWTIEQLRNAGISRVNVTTHYKKERIVEHFGNGEDFGVDIRYVAEDEPLGTAGALGLLERSDEPLLVINGDILTRVDFRAMHDFHREHDAEMTVAVRPHEYQIPYGVVETRGVEIERIREKPVIRHFISAGIYLLSPSVHPSIPKGRRYDMPELIETLLRAGKRVVGFPIREYWIDIGRIDDYERAKNDIDQGRHDETETSESILP